MAEGDRAHALDLYTVNAQLSQSLYVPLQGLEITLRNSIHDCLTSKYGDFWFDHCNVIRIPAQCEQIGEAKAGLLKDSKSIVPGQIVANLSFGFWTSFFGLQYEELWRQSLKNIVIESQKKSSERKLFSEPLTAIRKIRNRIAHHECILHPDLKRRGRQIEMITGKMSSEACFWIKQNSSFDEIYWKYESLLTSIKMGKKE